MFFATPIILCKIDSGLPPKGDSGMSVFSDFGFPVESILDLDTIDIASLDWQFKKTPATLEQLLCFVLGLFLILLVILLRMKGEEKTTNEMWLLFLGIFWALLDLRLRTKDCDDASKETRLLRLLRLLRLFVSESKTLRGYV